MSQPTRTPGDDRTGGARSALAAVAVLMAVLLALAVPAGAQEQPGDDGTAADPATTEPTPATPSNPAGTQLRLASQTPFVAPTDVLRIGLRVDGVPSDAELTFTLRPPVTAPRAAGTAQARFDAWVDGTADTSADPLNSPKTFPVADLPAGSGPDEVEAAFSIVPDSAPEPTVGFRLADPGVYPLEISVHGPGGGATLAHLTTFLVRLPPSTETAPPLAVAPITHLRAPVALKPDGSRAIDPASLTRIRTLLDTLDQVDRVPVTVDPTPETLEALLGTGSVPADTAGAATTGTALIDDLRTGLAGRSVLGSTYVTLDVDAWARSGMDDVLDYQRSHGANVTDAVIDHAVGLDERTWVASSGLGADGLAALRDDGVEQVVLDAATVAAPDGRTFPDQRRLQVASVQPFDVEDVDGDRVRAVTSDERLGERLRATDDEVLDAQTLVADLAVTYFGALSPTVPEVPDTPRGVAIEVPDDPVALRALVPLLQALATEPPAGGGGVAILSPTTLDGLFHVPPATADDGTPIVRVSTPEPVPGTPEDMGDYPRALEDAEFSLSAYESMVLQTEPDRVLPLRQLLDVSGAAGFGPDERRQYLDASNAAVDAGIAGVSVPDQDPITITATEYEVPVFVENDLSYAVSVRMTLSSPKLRFPDGDTFDDLRLEPGRNRIPVRVNTVSGGTFPLDVRVSTPDSRVELGQDTIEVRSTAVSGLGLAISIGAGFFLLVWWARNWRTTRRTNSAAGASTPPPADEPDAEPSSASFTVGSLEDLAESERVGEATAPASREAPSGGASPRAGATDNLG